MTSPITPSNGSCRGLLLTPGSRVLKTPLCDETIWKRLKEDGFYEESVKRRDKAAIIAYIAKLETEAAPKFSGEVLIFGEYQSCLVDVNIWCL